MRKHLFLTKFISFTLVAMMLTGCAQPKTETTAETIELIEPVGVAASFDEVVYRNLYDVKVYSSYVVPKVKEYGFMSDQEFDKFGKAPGQKVSNKDVLAYSVCKSIDKQIEELEDEIASSDEQYVSDIDALTKDISDAKKKTFETGEARAKFNEFEPEENTEAYEGWSKMIMPSDGNAKRAKMAQERLEEQLKERQELYELEREYKFGQIERLQAKKNNATVSSNMDGEVVAINYVFGGDNVKRDFPVIAVGDTKTKLLKVDYINKATVNKAKDYYAFVNGKRYEVTYEEMEKSEYNRLIAQTDKVYSTFYIEDPNDEVKIGDYAVLVMLNDIREDVLCVPLDAIKKEDDEYRAYIYDEESNTSSYVGVQIGMKDGLYAEVLSGLNEHDKVLSDSAPKMGSQKATLEKGESSNKFEENGFLFYPTSEWLKNPASNGKSYIKEILVTKNEIVQKGQTVATVEVVPDQIEIERNARKIQRAQERLVKLIKEKADLDAAKKIDRGVERGISDKNRTISQLMKEKYKLTKYSGIINITAPYDGIITDVGTLKAGDIVYEGSNIVQISDNSLSYIVVQDGNSTLPYGAEATISYKKDQAGAPIKVEGAVATISGSSLSPDMQMEYALISIPAENVEDMAGSSMDPTGTWLRQMFSVNVVTRKEDNVLLIPKSAVYMMNGSTYVRVLSQDGSVHYTSFISGGSDTSNYWVIDGLEEGMTICWE